MSTIDFTGQPSEEAAKIQLLISETEKHRAETERFRVEKLKLNEETLEIKKRAEQRWFHIRFVSLIQAVVGGIVAGTLLWSFAIEHVTKLYELQNILKDQARALKLEQSNLKSENQALKKREVDLEKINVQLNETVETSYQSLMKTHAEKAKLEADFAALTKQLGSIKSSSPTTLQPEIAAARKTLEVIKDTANSSQGFTQQIQELSAVQQSIVAPTDGSWFAVVASAYTDSDTRGKLEELRAKRINYGVQIYNTADKAGTSVYAITLGGNLKKVDAKARVEYARSNGIANDAYIWNSTRWGEDISSKFSN